MYKMFIIKPKYKVSLGDPDIGGMIILNIKGCEMDLSGLG
jgi:hypothetical protein